MNQSDLILFGIRTSSMVQLFSIKFPMVLDKENVMWANDPFMTAFNFDLNIFQSRRSKYEFSYGELIITNRCYSELSFLTPKMSFHLPRDYTQIYWLDTRRSIDGLRLSTRWVKGFDIQFPNRQVRGFFATMTFVYVQSRIIQVYLSFNCLVLYGIKFKLIFDCYCRIFLCHVINSKVLSVCCFWVNHGPCLLYNFTLCLFIEGLNYNWTKWNAN